MSKSGTEMLTERAIKMVCGALGIDPNVIVAQITAFGQTLASIASDFATIKRDLAQIKARLNMEATTHVDTGNETDVGGETRLVNGRAERAGH